MSYVGQKINISQCEANVPDVGVKVGCVFNKSLSLPTNLLTVSYQRLNITVYTVYASAQKATREAYAH